ncbi:maleylpyruvate isomerase family mycothiol-dependent enzyme [Salinactinospora qingdaonensis]|uniref:Maleylpyruvate isomerase family mycothiol-dependent enzyme n=1 Tax=Salinactinospora qingdaonensis TaxID=702744 RepID=A0ABP7FVD3_9ACTN
MPNDVAYRHVRQNVAQLLTAHPAATERTVAGCPQWRVRDLLAHLVEICTRVAGLAEEPEPSGDTSVADLLAIWSRVAEPAERFLATSQDRRTGVMLMDAFVHEGDLRATLGEDPPPGDHPAFPRALDVVVGGFSARARELDLPSLRIETGARQWVTGTGQAAGALRAGRHDLLRSLAGRRTPAQVARLSWSADHRVWLPAFTWGPFQPPTRPAEGTASAV